jgi:nitroreductase
MIPKATDTSAPIHDLLSKRYSGVSYDPDRHPTHEQLLALAEAARWSPSCFGDEPWRFIFCSRQLNPAAWEKAFDCLTPGNQNWCRQVPVLMLGCADTLFRHNDKPNRFSQYDTGAAAMSICVQASAMGMMTHQMGGFSVEKARELFNIPERYSPMSMMSIGYQVPPDRIPEEFREKELKPRQRQALSSRFFNGNWETGL